MDPVEVVTDPRVNTGFVFLTTGRWTEADLEFVKISLVFVRGLHAYTYDANEFPVRG